MSYRPPKTRKVLETHCQKRLKERYGLKYSQIMRDTLISHIRKGIGVCVVYEQSNRVKIYDIDYEIHQNDLDGFCGYQAGQTITVRAVYDKSRKTFCTFLTTDMDPAQQYDLEGV